MADNAKIAENASSTVYAACDEVTYSGDTSKIQLVRLVTSVTGSEGAKTVNDAAALADNIANPTCAIVGSFAHVYDGSTWDRLRGDATDGLLVNLGTNNDVSAWISDSAGNGFGGSALNSDGVSASLYSVPVVGAVYGYNGGSWDRIRGDTVNGLDIDVTRSDIWRVTTDLTMQNAVSSTGNGTTLTVAGYGFAVLRVSGTFTATINVEGSTDGGSTWTALTTVAVGGTDFLDSITTPGHYRVRTSGLDLIRARVTWSSGTSVTVVGRATNAPYVPAVARSVGNVAHDGVDSGAPVKVGLKAVAHGSNPTAVAAADRTDWYASRSGIPFVIGGHMNAVTSAVRRADADGSATDGAIGPGTVNAGTKVVVTRITVTCSNANTANVACKIGFGATNLPADSTSGAAGVLVDHEGIPPGGGFTVGDGSGILGIGGDGEELRWTVDDPVGGHVCCSVTYYTVDS